MDRAYNASVCRPEFPHPERQAEGARRRHDVTQQGLERSQAVAEVVAKMHGVHGGNGTAKAAAAGSIRAV